MRNSATIFIIYQIVFVLKPILAIFVFAFEYLANQTFNLKKKLIKNSEQ